MWVVQSISWDEAVYAGCSVFMGRGSVCGLFSLYHGTRQCMWFVQSISWYRKCMCVVQSISWYEAEYAGCSVYIMVRGSVCGLFSLYHRTRQCTMYAADCSVYIMGRGSVCGLFSLHLGTRQCMRVVQSIS